MVFMDCSMVFFGFCRFVQWFSCILVDLSIVFLDFAI